MEARTRIVWAGYSAAMGEHVSHLLDQRLDVECVADGLAALTAVRIDPPDLMLVEVELPDLDGMRLVRALRADSKLRKIPIILLSEREEALVESLQAGADDYLVKPFSARELLAYVQLHLRMARLRRESSEALRESEERFRDIFENAGVSIWLEDFSEVKKALDELRAQGVSDLPAYFSDHPEFVRRAIELVRIDDVNMETLELLAAESKAQLLGTLAGSSTPEIEEIFREELVALAEGRESLRSESPARTVDGRPLSVLFTIHFGSPERNHSRVVATLTDITLQKQAEYTLRERERQLSALNETLEERVEERARQVQELARRLTMAEHEERHRISQILHDDLQQLLYAIEMQMAMIRQDLRQAERPEMRQMLDETSALIQHAINTARQLTVDLSPPILQDEGLTDALGWLQSQMRELHGLEVILEAEHRFFLPDKDLRVLLFQTVRELLFNVKKHAGVNRATVTLTSEPERIVIHVVDEGRGFDVEEAMARAEQAGGFGLANIRQRLSLVGGRLEIRSQPGKGTRATVQAPRL